MGTTLTPPFLPALRLRSLIEFKSTDRAHCALTHSVSGLSNEIYVFAGEHEGAITFFNALARITGLIIFVPILGVKPDKRDTGTSCYKGRETPFLSTPRVDGTRSRGGMDDA